jgi:hypothetical protein
MEATKLVVEACEEDKAGVDFGINVSQTFLQQFSNSNHI